ncbi:MAG: T9SS type A sorting domain-containing protein [Bacteroidales bacterium]
MKKAFLLMLLAAIVSSKVISQCVPDTTYIRPGIYPDTSTGIPPAYATYLYEVVITAVIPEDTLFLGSRVPIDSIGVNNVIGLPEGFTTATDSPSGFWKGGKRGCMLITGTPTHQQVGEYPLNFKLAGYIASWPLPFNFDLTSYSLIIYDSVAFGIAEREMPVSSVKVFPNPFTEKYTIELYVTTPVLLDMYISDINNRVVAIKQLNTGVGINHFTFDASDLKPGLYFCRLITNDGIAGKAFKILRY